MAFQCVRVLIQLFKGSVDFSVFIFSFDVPLVLS